MGGGDDGQGVKYVNLEEVVGQVLTVARDQNGCRFLQRKFDEGGAAAVAVVFPEVGDGEAEGWGWRRGCSCLLQRRCGLGGAGNGGVQPACVSSEEATEELGGACADLFQVLDWAIAQSVCQLFASYHKLP